MKILFGGYTINYITTNDVIKRAEFDYDFHCILA